MCARVYVTSYYAYILNNSILVLNQSKRVAYVTYIKKTSPILSDWTGLTTNILIEFRFG